MIIIKYYDAKMLMTIDINSLFSVLFSINGSRVTVLFEQMTKHEQSQSTEDGPIVEAISIRFMVYEKLVDGSLMRREDIERNAIKMGHK